VSSSRKRRDGSGAGLLKNCEAVIRIHIKLLNYVNHLIGKSWNASMIMTEMDSGEVVHGLVEARVTQPKN